MIEVGQLLIFLFGFVIMPFVLIVATPFVLLWPRSDKEVSYPRTVGRRYLKIVQILSHLGSAIG